jgi:hypothetical protein
MPVLLFVQRGHSQLDWQPSAASLVVLLYTPALHRLDGNLCKNKPNSIYNFRAAMKLYTASEEEAHTHKYKDKYIPYT